LTDASLTPGTFNKARSTRDTHDAQVMPVTGNTQSLDAIGALEGEAVEAVAWLMTPLIVATGQALQLRGRRIVRLYVSARTAAAASAMLVLPIAEWQHE
jgi:hypothetical protein